jgi:hypothetical protein
MIPNLLGSSMSKSFVGVFAEQTSQEMPALHTYSRFARKLELLVDNSLKHFTLVAAIERRSAIEHFIDEYS